MVARTAKRVILSAAVGALALNVAAAEAADKPIRDMEIIASVEDELLFDQAVPLNEIDVEADAGIVQLTGTVDNLLAKTRATRLAETVKGVKSVVNRIKVVPSIVRSDMSLRRDVRDALLMDRATESYDVNVSVKDNAVTLTGTVESWKEKDLAEKVARGVRGVTDVKNRITVRYKTARPDTEIKPEIEQVLRWDALVDDALIDVTVNNGQVTLTGTVGSAAEKRRATWDTWVAGVNSVENSGLEVARWARDEDLRKDKYVVKSDEAVENAIELALLYDPRVMSFNVDADVDSGVATLRGTVDNLKAKRAAERDARNTVGVARVKNRIRVRPTTPADTEIAQTIREAFRRDPYVDRYEITVSVIDGTAYLYGTVDTYFEKWQADDVTSAVYGVKEVENHLTVETPDPLVYDPYVTPYSPYYYDWYDYEPYTTFMTDAEIQDEIRDEMWWSPFVDSDDVHIVVEDGEATLTGTVDSWSEFEAATENAYEGGAVWVDNDLTVE